MQIEKNIEDMELTYSIFILIPGFYTVPSRQRIRKYTKAYKRASYRLCIKRF